MLRTALKLAKPLVERFPYVANVYRQVRDNRYLGMAPRNTGFGFKFAGPRSMVEGTFEVEETDVVRRLLRTCDVFVNVGANVGYYCCHALSFGKPTIAFEPVERNLLCLYRNVQANHWTDSIEVFPLALSDTPRLVEMFGSGTGASLVEGWAGARKSSRVVPTSTLDLLLGPRFDGNRLFVLVDIEGAELTMLRGAKSLLTRDPKPAWMIEICVTEHQPAGTVINPHILNTFSVFWDAGYSAWTATSNPRIVEREEIEQIVRSGVDSLHTHNFLFVDSGQQAPR